MNQYTRFDLKLGVKTGPQVSLASQSKLAVVWWFLDGKMIPAAAECEWRQDGEH